MAKKQHMPSSYKHKEEDIKVLKGHCCENQYGLQIFIFLRRQQWYHLSGREKHADRAIASQSWDYLVYRHDLAVHNATYHTTG